VGVFALLGIGTAGYTAMRGLGIGPVGTLIARDALQEGARLVLADFGGAPEDSALARTVTEALRIDLSQSRVISLAEPGQVRQILEQMERPADAPLDPATAREVAIRGGMAAVIGGEIRRVGAGYLLTAQVVSIEEETTLVSRRETAAGETEIIPALDRLSTGLRERIGESLKTIRASPPLVAVTTSSLEALQKYAEAIRGGARSGESRVALLEEAVVLDSAFAMAWRQLGIFAPSPSRRIEARTKAFELRDRLADRERYVVMGTYYNHRGEADRPKAIDAYRTLLESYPDDALGRWSLAGIYEFMRDYAVAETLHARNAQLAPAIPWRPVFGPGSYWNMALNQFAQGKIEEAGVTLERGADLYPDAGYTQYGAFEYASARGDYETAEAKARAMSADYLLGNLYMVRGRLAEAGRSFLPAAEERQGPTDLALDDFATLAWMRMEAWYRGKPDRALDMLEEALEAHPLDSLPVLDRPYAALATFYAYAGRPGPAREMLTRYEATIVDDPGRGRDVHEPAGDVALAEGRYEDAIAEYRLADRAGWCRICGLGQLGRAYDVAGQPDSAIAVYERYVTLPWMGRWEANAWWLPFTLERLGALYDERGELEKASEYYARFVELWKDADPELQPRVQAAQQRLDEIFAAHG
jgi:tetratricopeptide (TPR) repeat protein/TolB-like protein